MERTEHDDVIWPNVEPVIELYERMLEISMHFSRIRSSIILGAVPVVIAVWKDGRYEFEQKYPDYVEKAIKEVDRQEKIYMDYVKEQYSWLT